MLAGLSQEDMNEVSGQLPPSLLKTWAGSIGDFHQTVLFG